MAGLNALEVVESHRRVHIIDDLLGAVLVLAALGFALLLELTRRRICAVYQLAFVLCAVGCFFVVGGLVDHHLSDDQLNLALYGSYLSRSLTTSYIYLPVFTAVGVSFAALLQLSLCSCQCCCLVVAASTSHARCFSTRIRANASLYAASFAALVMAIGTRLNARLRDSAINPEGGTVHWAMLRAPFFLAMAHIGSLLFVALKLFLQHADTSSTTSRPTELLLTQAPLNGIEDLMQPPPTPKKVPPTYRSLGGKTAHTRTPRLAASSASVALADAMAARSGQRRQQLRGELQLPEARLDNSSSNNDGDVSSLISSDSENDDEVIQPVFKSAEAASAAAAALATSPRQSAPSGYSSSPPGSPTSSITSSLSASSFARARGSRFRSGSGGPGSESMYWSDLDDAASGSDDRFDSRDYFSDRPSTASSTSTNSSYGLRHRATASHSSLTWRHAPSGVEERRRSATTDSPWVACLDPASGSPYYYNQHTGESRWDLT